LVTKYPIKKVELKEKGLSTLKPRKIWFDDAVKRLNVDGRGELIGEFRGEDRILIINQSGVIKTIVPEITAHFDDDMIVLEKWIPKKPISAIYYDGEKERYYVKRFLIENENKEDVFISDHEKSQLEIVSTDWRPMAEVMYAKQKGKEAKEIQIVNLEDFIAIKGIKAIGNQLTADKIKQVNLLEPLPYEVPEEVHADELEVVDEETVIDNDSEASDSETNKDIDNEGFQMDDEGQITLF
jgi:topoisomerase-4 subunit A